MYLDVGTGIQPRTHPPTLEFTLLIMFYHSIYETVYESLKRCEGKEIQNDKNEKCFRSFFWLSLIFCSSVNSSSLVNIIVQG